MRGKSAWLLWLELGIRMACLQNRRCRIISVWVSEDGTLSKRCLVKMKRLRLEKVGSGDAEQLQLSWRGSPDFGLIALEQVVWVDMIA